MAKEKRDKPPPGGWLDHRQQPDLNHYAVAVKGKKGKWIWKEYPRSRKDRELRKEWERRMAKADAKGRWHFKWPPQE
jgi:hypothetical protein